eukprot:12943457-Alexandrium_andersonii.AAC.1
MKPCWPVMDVGLKLRGRSAYFSGCIFWTRFQSGTSEADAGPAELDAPLEVVVVVGAALAASRPSLSGDPKGIAAKAQN